METVLRQKIRKVHSILLPLLLFSCQHQRPFQYSPSTPTKESSISLGGPSFGCLRGGRSLYPTSLGYIVQRPSRMRYYGHEALIKFITELGRKVVSELNSNILIGDMSFARGGPLKGGHESHQQTSERLRQLRQGMLHVRVSMCPSLLA